MTTIAKPAVRLALGVTGHRDRHPELARNRARIAAVLTELCDSIDAIVDAERASLDEIAPTRLHILLADGTDQLAAQLSAARGWEIVAPLPFGQALNLAINAHPPDVANAEALLADHPAPDPDCEARAAAIRAAYSGARLFELADQDAFIAQHFVASLTETSRRQEHQLFAAHSSAQVALAGCVMIEQSDLLIAVWDGLSANLAGGTGHTIAAALDRACPVIRIDPSDPKAWHILHAPESLAALPTGEDREAGLAAIVRGALRPGEGGALSAGAQSLAAEAWHGRSARWWTAYRRIEALFGGDQRPFRSLVTTYETPAAIATGSGAAMLAAATAAPGGDPDLPPRIDREIMQRFAWSDGISARLSDAYRGGMTASFILSALAILCGISYEPLGGAERKWMFALGEFLLLGSILVIIWQGGRHHWHKRWFETRRVAEYFRHGPILLMLGVARPPGRWPKGSGTAWPEYYARHALRALGLPRVAITTAYLRHSLEHLLDAHVVAQRSYHRAKAKRLGTVHRRLDKLSQRLFVCAMLAVSTYLVAAAATAAGLMPHHWLHDLGQAASFLGVAFPTFGAALAGIRYFGDFERFAAISEVTADKLDAVHARIALLLSAPDHALTYAQVAELAHATDETMIGEIESWQAVFGGKHITVPV